MWDNDGGNDNDDDDDSDDVSVFLYDLETSLFSLYVYLRYFLPVLWFIFLFYYQCLLKKEVLTFINY